MTKQRHIESRLRADILTGILRPGGRLPNYDELQKHHQVARATVLYAIRRLKEDGLIESRGRGGLLVSARPPHLHRYALVFPDSYADGNLFIKGFLRAIPTVEAELSCTIEVFERVREESGNEAYQRLLSEHAKGRLGGVLFLARPREYLNPLTCPLLADPDLPRIAFDSAVYPEATSYDTDMREAVRLGTRMLVEQGVRRLGILSWGWPDGLPDPRRLAMEVAPGIRCDEAWRFVTSGSSRFSLVRNLTCLLLAGDPAQRPDGLLVLDDHLADQVGLGVIDAGQAGKVHLVASGNLPPPEHLPVPVTWMGWHLQELLSTAIRDFASARAGTQLPGTRTFQPRQCVDATIAQAG